MAKPITSWPTVAGCLYRKFLTRVPFLDRGSMYTLYLEIKTVM